MTQPAWDPDDYTTPVDRWPAELDDDFEYLGELGRGGMAVVYRARDRELRREVAVKVVRPRPSGDDDGVLRVAREARTVARLQHQNIVSVHSIRRLGQGAIALIMQLVPGRTLKAELANGPLDPVRAERVLRDVASALAYAHKSGIVHRDVKPENIFIDEASGRAMLSDFGVARVMDAPTELTATGTTIGTPTYMAPEQIDGVDIDSRSDLYSLGVVGWEMLAGQRPWAGESLYNVIYRQKHDPLPPIDSFRADVPPKLQYLIEGLMHKKPDRRWSSSGLFISLLASDKAPPGLLQWQQAQERRRQHNAFLQSLPQFPGATRGPEDTVKFVRPGSGGGKAAASVPPSNGTNAPEPPVPAQTTSAGPPVPPPPAERPTVATASKRATARARRASVPLAARIVAVAAVALVALVITMRNGPRGGGAPAIADSAAAATPVTVDTVAAVDSLFAQLAREDSVLLASRRLVPRGSVVP